MRICQHVVNTCIHASAEAAAQRVPAVELGNASSENKSPAKCCHPTGVSLPGL